MEKSKTISEEKFEWGNALITDDDEEILIKKVCAHNNFFLIFEVKFFNLV